MKSSIDKLFSCIKEIYGTLNVSLVLQNPLNNSDVHLRVTIRSGLKTDAAITEYENRLFQTIEQKKLTWVLKFVTISQEWIEV